MLNEDNQKQRKATAATAEAVKAGSDKEKPRELNGPKGLEPTRYGDWEKAGRCIDF